MKKEEIIERYGEAEYARQLAQTRAYNKANKEEEKARNQKYRETHLEETKAAAKKYREEHPGEVIAHNQEQNRKGGRRYDKHLSYVQTGIPSERHRIRKKHARQYKPYKDIIAPESQIHHEWIPDTAEYRGVALVEANAHQYGIVDVIEILDGKITLLTEEEVRNSKKN